MNASTTTRAIRYRALPGSPGMAAGLNRLAGACRFAWNQLLADQEDLYRIAKMNGCKAPSPSYFTLSGAFAELRRATPWLQEQPFAIVRYTLKRQADAWTAFFRGQGGRPRFKSRYRCNDGFTLPDRVRINGGCIAIPKLGRVRLRRRGGNPYPDGKPKQAAFTRCGRKWYCTVFYSVAEPPRCANGNAIGVDMNARQVAASDGAIHRLPDMEGLEARRRRYQRMVSRRRKGSNRRSRARAMLAKTSASIAAKRSDWQHQVSRRIADSAEVLCIEDLRTKAMTRSAKGTAESPGRNVKAKAGLNRVILDTGWAALRQKLECKAGRVVPVDPAYTSQTCHECGHVSPDNRPSQAAFECVACDHRDNADINAAKNILASGIGAAGRGDGGVGWSVKRQIGSGRAHQAA